MEQERQRTEKTGKDVGMKYSDFIKQKIAVSKLGGFDVPTLFDMIKGA